MNLLNCGIEFSNENKDKYSLNEPFPHIVIDNFLTEEVVSQALAEFPRPDEIEWTKYNNPLEIKLLNSDNSKFGSYTNKIIEFLNSEFFLNFLENLTGFKNIIADEQLIGGGLHQIQRGGKLDIHADFNVHYKTKNIRCLNLILFLNKNWDENYGGHLELWDRQMSACQRKVLPIFNRAVIFSTDETSYHGHPESLLCPEDRTRKSIALYYYIENANNKQGRSTKYMKRPSDPENKQLDEFRELRSIPKDKRKA